MVAPLCVLRMVGAFHLGNGIRSFRLLQARGTSHELATDALGLSVVKGLGVCRSCWLRVFGVRSGAFGWPPRDGPDRYGESIHLWPDPVQKQ